ncbi:hypothetical protein JCM8547_007528 [Rhodosporidiobolus lusitaniae]
MFWDDESDKAQCYNKVCSSSSVPPPPVATTWNGLELTLTTTTAITDDEQVQNEEPHEASWSHELIAGAAAFEAQKAYADHCEANGKPENHEMAKNLLAGFAAAAADRLIETKGLDFIDKEKAQYEARKQAEEAVQPDRY